MVVCRFFMQGNCRYGNNCYNEHPSGGNQGYSVTAQRQLFGGGGGGNRNQNQRVAFRDQNYGGNQNPYKWVSQDAQQQQQQKVVQQTQSMSAADIVKGLSGEVTQNWEGGKMWPFTCLGFEKEMPSLPGFSDMSYEELRYEAYEAQSQGSIDVYVQRVQSLIQDLTQRRQELKNPSMTLRQKLTSFIEDCRKKKSSSGNQVSLFSDSSLFGTSGTSSQPTPGLFGNQSTSTLGQQQQSSNQSLFGQTGNNQSLFGQPVAQPSQAPFGGQTGNQSLFGQQSGSQTLFGKTPTFGQPAQSGQTSVFGQVVGQPTDAPGTPKMSLFGKPVEASTPQISNPTQNPFGQSPVVPSGSTFGVAPVSQPASAAPAAAGATCIYTPMSELTAAELEQFNANTFTVGSIPTRPPPRELCF